MSDDPRGGAEGAIAAGTIRRSLLRTALVVIAAGAGGALYLEGIRDQRGWEYGLLLGASSGLVTFPVALVEFLALRAPLTRRRLAGFVLATWAVALAGTTLAYVQTNYTQNLLYGGHEYAQISLPEQLSDLTYRWNWYLNLFAAGALPFVVVTGVRLAKVRLWLQCLLTPALTLGLGALILIQPDWINESTAAFALFLMSIGGLSMAPGFALIDAVERWRWGTRDAEPPAGNV